MGLFRGIRNTLLLQPSRTPRFAPSTITVSEGITVEHVGFLIIWDRS